MSHDKVIQDEPNQALCRAKDSNWLIIFLSGQGFSENFLIYLAWVSSGVGTQALPHWAPPTSVPVLSVDGWFHLFSHRPRPRCIECVDSIPTSKVTDRWKKILLWISKYMWGGRMVGRVDLDSSSKYLFHIHVNNNFSNLN